MTKHHDHDGRKPLTQYRPTPFERATFLGHIKTVQTARWGGLRITIDVPAQERDNAWPVADAIGPGYPVSIDVLKWSVPDDDPGPFARRTTDS